MVQQLNQSVRCTTLASCRIKIMWPSQKMEKKNLWHNTICVYDKKSKG